MLAVCELCGNVETRLDKQEEKQREALDKMEAKQQTAVDKSNKKMQAEGDKVEAKEEADMVSDSQTAGVCSFLVC